MARVLGYRDGARLSSCGSASVTVTGRRREPLEEVAASHPVVVPVVADVTADAGAAAVAESITERGGVLDVIVHSAGVFPRTPSLRSPSPHRRG